MGGRGQQGRAPPSTLWCMLGVGLSLTLGSWTGTPHRGLTDWDPSEETWGHQSFLSQGVTDKEEGTRWRCTCSPLGSLSRVTEEGTRAEKSLRHQGQGQPPGQTHRCPRHGCSELSPTLMSSGSGGPGTRLPCPHFCLSPCPPKGEASPFPRTISTCLCSSAKPPLTEHPQTGDFQGLM